MGILSALRCSIYKYGKVISFQDLPNYVSFSIGESIHWSQKPTQSSDASPWFKLEAVDVELTAYVLLAWLSKASLTQKEIAKATGIVAWLAKQRNAYGGFSSTQVNSLLSTATYQVGLDPMWR